MELTEKNDITPLLSIIFVGFEGTPQATTQGHQAGVQGCSRDAWPWTVRAQDGNKLPQRETRVFVVVVKHSSSEKLQKSCLFCLFFFLWQFSFMAIIILYLYGYFILKHLYGFHINQQRNIT